jgi:hypothetical protein
LWAGSSVVFEQQLYAQQAGVGAFVGGSKAAALKSFEMCVSSFCPAKTEGSTANQMHGVCLVTLRRLLKFIYKWALGTQPLIRRMCFLQCEKQLLFMQ